MQQVFARPERVRQMDPRQGDVCLLEAGEGVDVTAFSNITGQDVVTGFNASDSIALSTNAFSNWSAMLAHTTQSGADTVITLDAGDTLTLKNVTASTLSASNFHFG